jgi:hypothetical protein
VRVTLDGRTDEIAIEGDGVRVPGLGYALAPRREAALARIAGGRFVAAGARQPPAGAWMRLVTADGWVYPVRHEHAQAFEVAGGKLTLKRFPAREHSGAVRMDWRE